MSGCFDTQIKVPEKLTNLVKDHEGFKGIPYKDTRGFLSIGYGFNLDSLVMPRIVADFWLDYLLRECIKQCSENIKFFYALDEARKFVLISMAYNMGITGLLGFHGMLKALEMKDYEAAAAEMEDSQWYRQVPGRVRKLKSIMLSGVLE